MNVSLRTRFLIPLLMGGALLALLSAWVAYQDALFHLRDQVVKRGYLLGLALNEAAKATQRDDEIQFAVEKIVGRESSVFGIAVSTKDPMVIWASSFRPGTDEDQLTQGMLSVLRKTLDDGVFGHFWTVDGDLVTLVPLGKRDDTLMDIAASSAGRRPSSPRTAHTEPRQDPSGGRYQLPPDNYRGAIYLRFDWESVKQASNDILWHTAGIMLSGIVLMGILAYSLLHRTVLKRMDVIGSTMQLQKRGEEDIRVPALGNDEIGQLGDMFNQTLDTIHERDRRFRAVVDHLPVAISLRDIEGQNELINRQHSQWFGNPGTQINSISETENSFGIALPPRTEQERRVIDSGESVMWEEQAAAPGDERRVFLTSLFPVFNSKGNLDAIGSASIDITDRRRDEEELRQLSKAVESAGNGILIADARKPDYPVIYVNPAVEQVTGYSQDELIGRNPRFLHSDDIDQPGLDELRTALACGKGCRTILRNYRKDGSLFWNDFTLSPVNDSNGETSHWIGVQSDITERKKAEEHIEALAYFDALTEIPNRTLFHDRLQQALTHAQRSRQYVGLLYLDVDNFKTVNDTMGHEAGDRLLQAVAERVEGCVRQWDTVARMGGDEFTIIVDNLPPSSTVKTLTGIAEKVMTAISEPIMIDANEIFVTASIGIAHYPQDGDSVDELVKSADTAMYHSKSLGRNTYQFFKSDLDVAVKQRQRIEAQLRNALRQNEMSLSYQPQIDVASGRPSGVEVLLRWTNPVLGNVEPKLFVPAAESTGDIARLGEWVLRQACQQFQQWRSDGMTLSRLSVNLSPRQFRQIEFVSRVHRILRDVQLDPGCLELEVTEGSIIHDPENAIAVLQDLKKLGVRVAMDDFGTGYSSLRYLRELPIDVVKIDKSFIQELPSHLDDVEIVTAIIAMARGLKMEVIAEGVETDEQFALLRELGCDKVQGFKCCMPLPEKEFLRWMAERVAENT